MGFIVKAVSTLFIYGGGPMKLCGVWELCCITFFQDPSEFPMSIPWYPQELSYSYTPQFSHSPHSFLELFLCVWYKFGYATDHLWLYPGHWTEQACVNILMMLDSSVSGKNHTSQEINHASRDSWHIASYKCDAKSISEAQGNIWGWGGNIGFVLEFWQLYIS